VVDAPDCLPSAKLPLVNDMCQVIRQHSLTSDVCDVVVHGKNWLVQIRLQWSNSDHDHLTRDTMMDHLPRDTNHTMMPSQWRSSHLCWRFFSLLQSTRLADGYSSKKAIKQQHSGVADWAQAESRHNLARRNTGFFLSTLEVHVPHTYTVLCRNFGFN
jgi:hypothetical protein